MDKKIKAKWLKALRSGKYKQGHGYLKNNGEYCCLGVLCDVLKVEHAKRAVYLPKQAQEIAGIDKAGALPLDAPTRFYGLSGEGVERVQLANFNDNGLSFKRIAQLIEKYL